MAPAAASGAPVAPPGEGKPRWGLWLLGFGLPFLFLNTLLTFENRFPGAGVRFGARLSFELCIGLLALMGWLAAGRCLRPGALSALAALYSLLAVAHYGDVTVLGLLGRPPNLYWDAPHFLQVLRLAASSLPGWQIGAAVLGVLGGMAALYVGVRWSLALLVKSLAWHRPRRWLLAAGCGLVASVAVQAFAGGDMRWFLAGPVSPTIARQAVLLPTALSARRVQARLSPSPAFEGKLAQLHGADVLLIFAEAYGTISFDDASQAQALAPRRQRLLDAVRAGGRQVVSARVASPTFGGSSGLAHAALLAGVDTRRPDDHDLLLTTQRPTLVRHFARHGYRTVAWMPGLQRPWPEGSFYGFDRYAQADSVGYAGPAFGYWRIPDQASMALLQAQELPQAPRAPRFIVFPTVSTHAPFRPVAPFRADWDRLLRADAYSSAEVAQALAEPASWLEPLPAYLQALDYTHDWLADFLRERAPGRLLTIVIGDHQPLASVSGHAASWDVPVHVFSDDAALLRRFEAVGFRPGLHPGVRSLCDMHELTERLLQIFG